MSVRSYRFRYQVKYIEREIVGIGIPSFMLSLFLFADFIWRNGIIMVTMEKEESTHQHAKFKWKEWQAKVCLVHTVNWYSF